MAVYKATLCYPFLNSIDIRIIGSQTDNTPAYWLKCKVESSNKEITGYRVRILDSDNNQIFPVPGTKEYISPISELINLGLGEDFNTGFNGTYLQIPFFQNKVNYALNSFNSIYFDVDYRADYIIHNTGEGVENSQNWQYYKNATTQIEYLVYEGWDGILNNELVMENEIIYVIPSSGSDQQDKGGMWIVLNNGSLIRYKNYQGSNVDWAEIASKKILITKGIYHDKTYLGQELSNYNWTTWTGEKVNFTINEGSYKWTIELFQGKEDFKENANSLIYYHDNASEIIYNGEQHKISFDWYDMVLTTGTILGSTHKRIQIANDDYELPEGTATDALVLQGKYVQLLTNDNAPSYALRGYVQTYDTTFGHIYPKADSFGLENINLADKVAFYKYSNDPEYILATDKVVAASNGENVKGLFDGVYTYPVDSWCFDLDYIEKTSEGNYKITLKPDNILPDGGITIANGASSRSLLLIKYDAIHYAIVLTSIDGPVNGYVEASDYSGYGFSSDKYFKITEGADTGKIFHGDDWYAGAEDPEGLIVLGGVQLHEGDYVLLKDQINPLENGVYIAHDRGTLIDDKGKNIPGMIRWQRAGSYDTWGDFIGKIIFVTSGVNGGKNFESLATPGGKLYYTENSASNIPGATPLIFKEEKPLLLYPNKLTATVDIAYGVTVQEDSETGQLYIDTGDNHGIINNYFVSINNLIFNTNDNKIYSVSNVSENIIYIDEKQEIDSPSSSTYIYSLNGEDFGKEIIYYNGEEWQKDSFILRSANILKNSKTRTFISPYTNLAAEMALKLMNNKLFVMNDMSTSKYLKINNFNKKVWYIDHEELREPLSSMSLDDSSIPYKYELRSYFRASDENPFVTYEEPYLKLGNTLEGYTNIWTYSSYDVVKTESNEFDSYDICYNSNNSQERKYLSATFYLSKFPDNLDITDVGPNYEINNHRLNLRDTVLIGGSGNLGLYEYQYDVDNNKYIFKFMENYNSGWYYFVSFYGVENSSSFQENCIIRNGEIVTDIEAINSIETPYLVMAAPLSTITNRYIKLRGFYYQYQQLSWESYRWVLINHEGTIIQDTGKKYDKKMEVAFYGLSNNSQDNQNIYYAVLYVEDSVGNNLSLAVRLIVDPTSAGSAGIPFNAEFDCQTHSMLLSYQDNSLVYPSYNSYLNKIYDKAYIIQNKDVLSHDLEPLYRESATQEGDTWDYSVGYQTYEEDGYVVISGLNMNNGVVIPNIYTPGEEIKDNISYTEAKGLCYKHYFADNSLEVDKDKNNLEIEGDEATFSTNISPCADYAGDIFNINCEAAQTYQDIDFQYSIPSSFLHYSYYNNTIIDNLDDGFVIRVPMDITNTYGQNTQYYISYYTQQLNQLIDNNLRLFNSEEYCKKEYFYFNLSPNEIIPAETRIKFLRSHSSSEDNQFNMEFFNQNDIKFNINNPTAILLSALPGPNAVDTKIYINNLNPIRNNILFKITCSDYSSSVTKSSVVQGIVKDENNNNWVWNNMDENNSNYQIKYFLQPENSASPYSKDEYLNFSINGAKLWYINQPISEIISRESVLNSRFPLGNLCLIDKNDLTTAKKGSSVYWSEDRGILKYIGPDNKYIDDGENQEIPRGINLCISKLEEDQSSQLKPYWPSQDSSYEDGRLYLPEGEYDPEGNDLIINNGAIYVPQSRDLIVEGLVESNVYWIDNDWINEGRLSRILDDLPYNWDGINDECGDLVLDSVNLNSIERWSFKERLSDFYKLTNYTNNIKINTRLLSIEQLYNTIVGENDMSFNYGGETTYTDESGEYLETLETTTITNQASGKLATIEIKLYEQDNN